MEEDFRKRNTDCVYFLASPFTCKKGIECEFRHSEMARLNPTDCWYWLTGNCLNPTCAFRHPPLDTPAEAPPASVSLAAAPLKKNNVPCYFYFNGFCNKGDKCSFAHGPEVSTLGGKSSKTAIAITEALDVENKTTFIGNGTRSAPRETHLYPSEGKPKVSLNIKYQPKEVVPQPAPRNVMKQSMSLQISVSDCDAAVVWPCSLPRGEGYIQSSSPQCTDQSSEEQECDDHVELETRWDSSPGFDVFVVDKSENLGFEDDPEYSLTHDRELNSHFLGYEFEDAAEFDPSYSDTELLYDCQSYDFNDHLHGGNISDIVRRTPRHSSERMFHSILSQKRKLLPMELEVPDQNGVDLRDHLRKRRVVDSRPIACLSRSYGRSRSISRDLSIACLSRSHERSHSISRYHERSRRSGTDWWLHGRFSSEVGKSNVVEWHEDNETHSNRPHWHDLLRRSQSNNRSRKHYKDQRLDRPYPEALRKRDSRERASQTSIAFTGPKPLSQIKQETRKVEENRDFEKMKHSSRRTSSTDFQGPKPLSEILEEKRRVGSIRATLAPDNKLNP